MAQRAYQCGPAALASVFHYWGRAVPAEDIARVLSRPGARGVVNFALARYAREQGFWTQVTEPDLQGLKGWIARRVPPVVLLRVGPHWLAAYHFVVLKGYNEREGYFYANTGHPETRAIRYGDLERRWEDAARWTLIVCPPDHVQWAFEPDQAAALASLLERSGRLDLAAQRYRQALESRPTDAALRFNLGNVYRKAGRLADARTLYAQLLREEPGETAFSNNLAWISLEEGRYAEAVRVIEAAFRNGAARRADILDTAGLAHCRLRHHAQAAALFEEALAAIAPDEPSARQLVLQHLEQCRTAR